MNNYNAEFYADRYSDPESELTSAADIEMNVNWMRDNPAIAVEHMIKFFEDHNDKHFNHRCVTRFVPSSIDGPMKLGYITLGASKKMFAS